MRYLGGKSRIAKPILEVILANATERTGVYWEPFIGGGGMASKAAKHFNRCIYSDQDEDLMLMWEALATGWEPPEQVSEEEYKALRHAEPSALRGFVGYGCSFGGKWFGGYARSKKISGDPTQDLEKWKDTGGIDPALKVDYTNGVSWGKYQQAVILWSNVTGVWPPNPTKPDGRNGRHRLSSGFADWMMGWPAGHVTDESLGLTRTQQLKAVGNGVVTRQAIHAGNQLLERLGCKSHSASGF